ncbi:hypothetical protein ACEPAF_289 [Sanghuangporus sanghuang]
MVQASFIFGIFVLVLIGALHRALSIARRVGRLPPIAKFPGYSSEKPWIVYASVAKAIGSIFRAPTLGRTVIIIDSAEIADELLGTRSNFSCRPVWPMAELLGKTRNVVFQRYGDRLKKLRKVLQASLGPTSINGMWAESLDTQTRSLCKSFLDSPERFYDAVGENMIRHTMANVYGQKLSPELLRDIQGIMHDTSIALQPGRWMVNSFPFLKWVPTWFPGAGFHRWASGARELYRSFTLEQYNAVKADMRAGIANISFVKASLENLTTPYDPKEETLVMDAAESSFFAGIDSTVATILTFIALMPCNEHVQARAYSEICSIIGTDRLPDIKDRPLLPYVDCIIQEVYRFSPVVPLITHSNIEEDQFGGFRIPKRSWVLVNVWSIMHDDLTYPSPGEFLPERFMMNGDQPGARDPRLLIFGYGRRRCPGIHFAETLVYLIVSRTLALFHICPDTFDGKPVAPMLNPMARLVAAPERFSCRIVPRAHTRDLLSFQ